MMDVLTKWMSENPGFAAVAVVLSLLAIGIAKVFVIGDKAERVRREGEDEAKDHHNDMISSNRGEESELRRARRSVGDWIKRVRGGQ